MKSSTRYAASALFGALFFAGCRQNAADVAPVAPSASFVSHTPRAATVPTGKPYAGTRRSIVGPSVGQHHKAAFIIFWGRAAQMTRLANAVALRDQLAKAGYERAQTFAWPQIAAQYLEIYRAVIDNA